MNPNETCEFPEDVDTLGGNYLIVDTYGTESDDASFGMMAVIEIHRKVMDYAKVTVRPFPPS